MGMIASSNLYTYFALQYLHFKLLHVNRIRFPSLIGRVFCLPSCNMMYTMFIFVVHVLFCLLYTVAINDTFFALSPYFSFPFIFPRSLFASLKFNSDTNLPFILAILSLSKTNDKTEKTEYKTAANSNFVYVHDK